MKTWKDIPNYEGYYQINEMGIVMGVERTVKHSTGSDKIWKSRYILQSSDKHGYMSVTLAKKGKNTKHSIHRLVAQTFITNPENKPCVNHLNGVKCDNHISNLEWCTYSENEKHSYRVLGKKPNKTALGKIPPNARYIGMYSMKGVLINTYRTATEAAKHIGGNQGRVSTNCRGEQPLCYGYKYVYISKELYLSTTRAKMTIHKLPRKQYANPRNQWK